jgi:hypothetical protein
MDINYFLLMRGRYNNILSHIDSIIDEFDEIEKLNAEYLCHDNKQFFIERKKHILYLKNLCNEYIQNMCNHEFETDTIDINPDESRTISYCKICEFTRI